MRLRRQLRSGFNVWAVLSVLSMLIIVLPNLNILLNVFNEPNENWFHIKRYLLNEYVVNTLIITVATGVLSILIGTSLAWVISVYEFPLRRFFKWGLILPLTIPPYIAAYTYNGLLNYTGVLQTFLRNTLDIRVQQKYLDIMSTQGAIFIFTIFLFPYVYAITKAFIEKQSAALIESSRVLGRSPLEIFWFVILPVSRAAIVGGTTLVLLEVINDYGVVQYFGITTFSTAIFRSWSSLGDLDTAIKLAGMLMAIVISILVLEKLMRGNVSYSSTTTKVRPITRIQLKGVKSTLAFLYSAMIFSVGFLVPTVQLIYWGFLTYDQIFDSSFWSLAFNSLWVAVVASVIAVVIALIIANYTRISQSFFSKLLARATVIGYSIPGAVISIGIIVFFIAIDNKLYWFYQMVDPNSAKLVLSSSILMLIFAYVIRFVGIGFNSVEAGFEKVGMKFFEASRTLGMSVTKTFFKVDLKMLTPAVVSAFTLVFVDIMKELPLTLFLRPFNFETLATKVYQYANDEVIHEAAIPSLLIISISFISIYAFQKVADKEER